MLESLKKFAVYVVIALALVVAIWSYVVRYRYEGQLADLRNQAASKDKTTEEFKNTFTKLAGENDDLKSSSKDLQKLLSKTNQDLIAETQAKVYWKGRTEYELSHRPVAPVPGTPEPFKPPVAQVACTEKSQVYTSTEDIGLLKLTIDTYTIDPSYQTKLRIDPGSKPLVLTLDLTRDQKRQWHTHVVSSDDRIGVDIGINTVNIEPLAMRWYEHLKIVGDIGAGSRGLLAGVGMTYGFGKWEAGPKFWATTDASTFTGATIVFIPFKRAE